MSVLLFLWKYKFFTGAALVVLIVGGTILYLHHRNAKLESELNKSQQENKRLEDKSEGLKILVNAKTTAQEIENEKRIANMQETNSRVANADYINNRMRDSSESSGNFAAAKEQFCREFCDDSACAGLRAAGKCTADEQP